MIDRVAADRAVTPELRQRIVERADGIPLFVQEMTKAALKPTRNRCPRACRPRCRPELDRLGEAREVAQLGAAIGREFPHALLAAAWTKRMLQCSTRRSIAC